MTFKKWAWDIFETTGNLEAFLAMKEAETQEKNKTFGKMEFGNLELDNAVNEDKSIVPNETQINGDIDGVNKN